MVNEYTSVATTPGLGDNLVKAAYDLALGRALNNTPTFRHFATVKTNDPSFQGSSITKNKVNYFSEASVTAAKTPLTEEADVDSTKMPATTPVTLTPKEYGFAVTRTKLLAHRTFAPFDQHIAENVADHAGKVIDELIQDQLKADITEVTVDGGAENALTNADKLTAAWVRKVVTGFKRDGVRPFDGQFYVSVVNPDVLHDLREENGPGSWRISREYVEPSKLISGEFGEFEGVRFISNARTRKGAGAASTVSHNSYFFGAEGLWEHVVEDVHSVLGPVVDKLHRFQTVGWYGDLGWKVYEPKAIQIMLSSSSLSA